MIGRLARVGNGAAADGGEPAGRIAIPARKRGDWAASAGRMVAPAMLWIALGLPGPALARDALGIYQGWAAFRDRGPSRCFAIAEPEGHGREGRWRPFAAVTSWPEQGLRAQLHIHLRARKRYGAPISLAIGDARFALAAGAAEAWAPDAAGDARIVAAIRSGRSMSIETTGRDGRPMVDVYRLRGAASAIDAATLACIATR